MTTRKSKQGGARAGAGRPALGGETITVYVAGWRIAAMRSNPRVGEFKLGTQILMSIDIANGLV